MDVVVGSTWPVIARVISVDISLIGILVMFYYLGAIITSPRTYKIRQRLGTNYTMVLSQICFCLALIFYLLASNIFHFALGMFVNGMGCGLMEVNANSYTLKAYDVKGESLLSSFWGLGSVIGSTVMAAAVKYFPPYKSGFKILVAILLINIVLLLILKAGWIKQRENISRELLSLHSVTEEEKKVDIKFSDLIKEKKIFIILICFLLAQGVIITLNSLVSTIAVSQGMVQENVAVGMAILFFAAIFLGRMLFGYVNKNVNVIKVLKMNSIIACILLALLSLSPLNGVIICLHVTVLGFILSPIIPFLNSYIKEEFDTTLLSALLGYGDVCGIIGIIIASGLTTLILKTSSIRTVEMFFAMLMLVLYILLKKEEKTRNVI